MKIGDKVREIGRDQEMIVEHIRNIDGIDFITCTWFERGQLGRRTLRDYEIQSNKLTGPPFRIYCSGISPFRATASG